MGAQSDKDKAATETVEAQREIQAEIDRKDEKKTSDDGSSGAMQAGQRNYPTEFKEQHLLKPGAEADLDPAPMYEAPAYRGSDKLAGMTAIITGGDSGIGRAVAVLFAREGADVAIVYLCEHDDAKTTKRAVEKEGRRCMLIAGEVSDPDFCRYAVDSAKSGFGKFDILVNNAAFQEHASDILDISDEHFDRTLKTNLYGYFYMTRAAIPHLQPGSAIVMSGSVTGIQGSAQVLDYSMTKGGIHAFARSLSASLLPKGIRVNVVAPGPVWTPLNPADRPAKAVKSFGSSTPMGRAAQPEEIAPAYVFFTAPSCSSYITGEILPIIGGYG